MNLADVVHNAVEAENALKDILPNFLDLLKSYRYASTFREKAILALKFKKHDIQLKQAFYYTFAMILRALHKKVIDIELASRYADMFYSMYKEYKNAKKWAVGEKRAAIFRNKKRKDYMKETDRTLEELKEYVEIKKMKATLL